MNPRYLPLSLSLSLSLPHFFSSLLVDFGFLFCFLGIGFAWARWIRKLTTGSMHRKKTQFNFFGLKLLISKKVISFPCIETKSWSGFGDCSCMGRSKFDKWRVFFFWSTILGACLWMVVQSCLAAPISIWVDMRLVCFRGKGVKFSFFAFCFLYCNFWNWKFHWPCSRRSLQ